MSIDRFEEEQNAFRQQIQEDETWQGQRGEHRQMIAGFMVTSAEMMKALDRVIGLIEQEHQATGLTDQVNIRLGQMAEDIKPVGRTLNLITETVAGFVDRVERMRNS